MQVVFSWTHLTDRAGARELVAAMREAALRLPFVSVSEIFEDDWGPNQLNDPGKRDEPGRPRLTEAQFGRVMRRWPRRWFIQNEDDFDAHGHLIQPTWTCYFIAKLDGCDPVSAGLAQHVETVNVEREFGVSEASTNLHGRMAWHCRCETLNACVAGWDHFFKQHTTVLKFLEAIEPLGLEMNVWDQGMFWETTNPDLLREEMERSAAITAHTLGHLKSRLKDDTRLAEDVPLLKHPQFEQLEARGAEIMAEGPGRPWREHFRKMNEGEEWKQGAEEE